MKIRRFVKAQSGGAFSVDDIKSQSPQLYETAKSLSPQKIKELIFSNKDFVPLDLVALIYHVNQKNFLEALNGFIRSSIRNNTTYRHWMAQMGIDADRSANADEMVSSIMSAILSNDPNKRGVLNQIALDGSRAGKYRYERSENSDLARSLKNSLKSTQGGLAVPHCPTCAQAGIDKPLWSYNIEGTNIKAKPGLEEERCTTIEKIDAQKIALDQVQGNEIGQDGDLTFFKAGPTDLIVKKGESAWLVKLQERQIDEFESGLRSFQFHKGNLIFRCTFNAKLPSVPAFLGYSAIKAELSKIWQSWQRQHGQSTDFKRLDRLKELEEKAQKEGLTPAESKELVKNRRYKERRDRQFTSRPVSLDAPTGTEDESRSRHESIQSDDVGDFADADVREAQITLENALSPELMRILEGLKPSETLFLEAVSQYSKLSQLSAKDSAAKNLSASYAQALHRLAEFYLYGPEDKRTQKNCITCGADLDDAAKICRLGIKMQKDAYDCYVRAKNVNEYNQLIQKFEPHVAEHYKKSGVGNGIADLFAYSLEVTEDDLDLSFDDEKDHTSKLNFNDFKSKITRGLSPEQMQHFNGTLITKHSENNVEIEELDNDKIQKIAKEIDQLISTADEEDLLPELTLFHRA